MFNLIFRGNSRLNILQTLIGKRSFSSRSVFLYYRQLKSKEAENAMPSVCEEADTTRNIIDGPNPSNEAELRGVPVIETIAKDPELLKNAPKIVKKEIEKYHY
ncbi:hypothetical protein SJAG_04430 [Schizosaccharomyces japonicus yFS275]|uniref:Uncharacterized protein n=1 Tax=Schizosaccharomyces japonicus (strain yFS275 / FY16936) TaxID=402676 RepID=B6K6U1_SCHJY|nr:hypothetical protein SJAG_04430 [Schizosaccharomyces japonicus yFS275]EEB09245.1 hypothetical protein SJAG_04430 [Schizosaccharomyces japonicus yFS275]